MLMSFMVFAFCLSGSNVDANITSGSSNWWDVHHCILSEYTLWQAYVHLGAGLWPMAGMYKVVMYSTAPCRGEPCATQISILQKYGGETVWGDW